MKHLILSVILSLLFATAAYADEIIIESNDKGQVIVNEDQSIDGNTYILNAVEPNQLYNVQMLSETTFSTHTYSNGFFDTRANYILSHDLEPAIYDNNLTTSVSYQGWRNFSIEFIKPLNLTGIFFKNASSISSYPIFTVDFFNDNGAQIGNRFSSTSATGESGRYQTFNYNNVSHLDVITADANFAEFELFFDEASFYSSVADLKVEEINHESALAKWKNPADPNFVYNQVFLDDVLIADDLTTETLKLDELAEDSNYKLNVRSYYVDDRYVDSLVDFKTDFKPLGKIEELAAIEVASGVKLTYKLPKTPKFSHLKIVRNGMVIADNFTTSSYIDSTVNPNTQYTYRVIVYDKSNNYYTSSVMIKTTQKDIFNLKANAKYDAVKLTWTNPENEKFESVTIYRKNKGIVAAIARSLSFNATAGYTQLFRTNGTMFEDLTVASDSTYTYLLTSAIASEVTNGVTIDVKTPKITVEDANTQNDDNGDYLVSWTKPDTGKLLIKVGGVQYKIVDAADKQLLIPSADMVYNAAGNPDIQLVAIDEQGNEIGIPANPGGAGFDVSLDDAGLDAKNLMIVAMLLIGLVMSIILLALAFRVTPKLIDLIVAAFK